MSKTVKVRKGVDCPLCDYYNQNAHDPETVQMKGWYRKSLDKDDKLVPCDHRLSVSDFYALKSAIHEKRNELKIATKMFSQYKKAFKGAT